MNTYTLTYNVETIRPLITRAPDARAAVEFAANLAYAVRVNRDNIVSRIVIDDTTSPLYIIAYAMNANDERVFLAQLSFNAS